MASSAAEIGRLRDALQARFGSAVLPAGAPAVERFPGFGTGIAAIDALLPGGVPRGMLSVWLGDTTAGRTAALRALVLHACGEGARVAVVDAGMTLDAGFACTAAGPAEGVWVARPPSGGRAAEGAWAAEALLRSGAFDLVILDGCLPDAAQAHRLRALARERDAAVVVTAGNREPLPPLTRPAGEQGTGTTHARAVSPVPCSLFPVPFRPDVRLEFRRVEAIGERGLRPGGRFRRRARVRAERGGGGGSFGGGEREVELSHEPADRLCTHTPAPDRSTGRR
jgi:hypothetical protein